MNITVVQGAFLPVPPIRGGAIEKAFYSLTKEFVKEGHNINYISRLCDDLPRIESEGPFFKHHRVKGYNVPRGILLLKYYDLLYSWRVLKMLPSADILVTHTFWLPILARNSSTQGKVYIHVGRAPKGQMVLYKNAARFQTVSTSIAEAIERELPCAMHNKIVTIPYPLESNFLRHVECVATRARKILYAGRIHPEKGIGILIDAFLSGSHTEFKDWSLEILGPWEIQHGGAGLQYLDQLKRKASCLSRISFLEPIFDQLKLAEKYAEASIFIYPSLSESGETFGLAALEALARGCLTIVSSLECFLDFVRPGQNAFVFNHRLGDQSLSLANTMIEAIGVVERGDDQQIRSEARKTAEEYNCEKVAKQYLKDFERVLA